MQFLYKLTLIERLQKDEDWTDEDEAVVATHFQHLKKWTEEGKVVMAGRTTNEGASAFGIVIFHAENDEEAEVMMKKDPAIEQGIMTGELYPFHLALHSSPIHE